MRILICDDDTLIIEQLKKYIESYFESIIIYAICKTGKSFWLYLQR